jgi:hypothetical protein
MSILVIHLDVAFFTEAGRRYRRIITARLNLDPTVGYFAMQFITEKKGSRRRREAHGTALSLL